MEETINRIIELTSVYGLKVIAALAVFIIGKWLARVFSEGLEQVMEHKKVDATLASFLKHLVYYGLFTFVLIATLSQLGIQTASFVAVLGAAGLAVGLALQGSLSNFAAGVMIILFRPFKVGDFVVTGGAAGTVKEIQIFNTVLSSPDNVKIVLPNSQITGGSITNYSANETRRVDLVIGVSYEDDLQKTRRIIENVITADPRVLKDPAPVVAVNELAESSVNFVVRPWVRSTDYWGAYFDLTEKIKVELDKGGVTIPFPQRDLHIKTDFSKVAPVLQKSGA